MAKQVKMMVLEGCPHCAHAFELMKELKLENPQYADIDVEIIDERRDEGKIQGYDFWYVPAFFVNGVEIFEGVPTKNKIEDVFMRAI
ncbi:MAG: thioredoxin family protein [Christensenella sp.]